MRLAPLLFICSLLGGALALRVPASRNPTNNATGIALANGNTTGIATADATGDSTAVSDAAAESRGPYWQKLRNLIDIQYFGDIVIGGQEMSGLYDTGSFEILVFGEQCNTCGKAVAYHHSRSKTYRAGNTTETHSFGSGTCYSNDAYERVEMGPFVADQQPIWEVARAQMPVLEQANFQAIVGIGPPGEPALTAKTMLEDAEKREQEYKDSYGYAPAEITDQRKELEQKVEVESEKKSLLENLGMSRFSSCLGRSTGSSGWLVFNDADPRHRAEQFMELPVAGKLTWSVQVTELALVDDVTGKRTPLGCSQGCGAIVDTGTSLFSVPTHVYQKLYDVIRAMNEDCNDLTKFPDFSIKIGEQELRFGADSYLGRITGNVPQAMKKLVHASANVAYGSSPAIDNSIVQLGGNSRNISVGRQRRERCQLLLMDMGEEITQLGPLTILGMPFFREYYTTFELGKNRTIHIARADEECRPTAGKVSLRAKRRARPRKVDASKLRVPGYVRNDRKVSI